MLSELTTYYKDDDKLILPFIVAPVSQQQDSLIIAPQSIAKIHDSFLNQIYSTIPNTELSFVYIRAFDYNSYVAIIVIFPSSIKEDKTNRSGLVLTLGALIDKKVFIDYSYPSSTYFDLFILLFNDIFNVDLFKNGADNILKQLTLPKFYPKLKNNFERLLLILHRSTFNIRRSDNFRFSLRFRKKNKYTSLPKMIIHEHKMDVNSYLKFFLSEIDRHLEQIKQSKIDVSSDHLLGDNSLTLLNVNCLPSKFTKVELKKIKKQRCIYLY